MESLYEPNSLREAIVYFSDEQNCLEYLMARRPEWKDGVVCPRCGSTSVGFLKNQFRWQCSVRHPRRQFSIKVGTIMEDSPIGLDKWLPAMWMLQNCKNGISSCEIARAINVTQKSAWFMLHRIRLAQQGKQGGKFTGPCEADETFIGQKARNMHRDVKERKITGTGGKDKTAVMGILERGTGGTHSKVRATVVPNRRKSAVQPEVRKHVQAGAALYTDALKSYEGLSEFEHGVIDHAEKYVSGQIHTNGMENFWSLLKRGLNGTYVSVEPFHLFRYLDEQVCRFNNRELNDTERFNALVSEIGGKRITYAELTGKTEAATEAS